MNRRSAFQQTGMGGGLGGGLSFEQFTRSFNNNPIEKDVKNHMQRVYSCTALYLLATAAGVWLGTVFMLHNLSLLFVIGSIGLFFAAASMDQRKMGTRFSCMAGAAMCLGFMIHPLVAYAVHVDPSVLVTAIVGTAVISVSLTLAVMFAPRGYWFWLGGFIAIGTTVIMAHSFLAIFGLVPRGLYWYWPYFMVVFVGAALLFDTTIIMEKCRLGDKDYVMHGYQILQDIVSLFIHILSILLQNKGEDRKKKRRD